MAAKSGRKTIFGKSRQQSVGQKFHRNCCILLRFRDKHVFAFYEEIHDGCQKWRENDYWEKLLVDSADTLWVKNFVEIVLSRSVSEINVFLQIHLKISDIYFCHYFATNKKIAIVHLWHAMNYMHAIPNYMPSYS